MCNKHQQGGVLDLSGDGCVADKASRELLNPQVQAVLEDQNLTLGAILDRLLIKNYV